MAQSHDSTKGREDFRFLDLVPELRCVVYDFVFQAIELELRYMPDKYSEKLGVIPKGSGRHVFALPLTCKQIYDETRIHLVRASKLSITHVNLLAWRRPVLTPAISSFTLEYIRYVQGIPLMYQGYNKQLLPQGQFVPQLTLVQEFGQILGQMPNLRVCVAKEVDVRDTQITIAKIQQCHDSHQGASVFFQHCLNRTAHEVLRAVGVDEAKLGLTSSVQIIQPLDSARPEIMPPKWEMVSLFSCPLDNKVHC